MKSPSGIAPCSKSFCDRSPAQQVHGFTHLSVTHRALELPHLDADGRFLYGISKTPAGKVSMPSA